LIQTDAIEVLLTVVGVNPETVIGEETPVTVLSGIAKAVLLLKLTGPTDPTAVVDALKVKQAEGQTAPPVPAFAVGSGLTVTVCVTEF
jgi:hypothetical protein